MKTPFFHLSLMLFLFVSCVYVTPDDDEQLLPGTTPFLFTADICAASQTRLQENSFSEGDSVGIFAVISPGDFNAQRYIDNQCFCYSSALNAFTATTDVFYPEGDVALDVMSYFPYRDVHLGVNQTTLEVGVEPDQRSTKHFYQSNFLVATQKAVAPTDQSVKLSYFHQFSKMKVMIELADGLEAQLLREKSPFISISGCYTKASYDFLTKTFSGWTRQSTIFPHGQWIWDEAKRSLIGMEAILIPQQVQGGQRINLEVGGRIYYSTIPQSTWLESGKQCTVKIVFKPLEERLISHIEGGIVDWEGTDVWDVDSQDKSDYIDVESLDFRDSGIYEVVYGGKVIGQICKEYLLSDQIQSQAIVAYPMDLLGQADLKHGLLVKRLDGKGFDGGRNLSWGDTFCELSHGEGDLVSGHYLFFNTDGQIFLADKGEGLKVYLRAKLFRDIRGRLQRQYPIIKIGTQYWLGEDWSASNYLDGSPIPLLPSLTVGAKGYLLSDDGEDHFYSSSLIGSNGLLPSGLSIPTWDDWNRLKLYLCNNADLLKEGLWLSTEAEESSKNYLNETGFGMRPIGFHLITEKGAFYSSYKNKYIGYWVVDHWGDRVASEKSVSFKGVANGFFESSAKIDEAYPIRCICR